MRIYKYIFLLSFVWLSDIVIAQNELKVRLVNSENNEPISYATIRFKGTSRGLIADYNGQFRIPFTDKTNLPDLIITSIGFQSIELRSNEFDIGDINVVKMIPKIESLQTVFLNASSSNQINSLELARKVKENNKRLGRDIVAEAIALIPENLNNSPHSLVGYYRDYQVVNNQYYNLNEGIIEQFDKGITTHNILDRFNQHAFYSFKRNENFEIDTALARAYSDASKFIENASIVAFGGNELSILNVHNPIRNYNRKSFSYVYQLNEDFINNHIFKKEELVFKESEPLINISFSTKKPKKHFNHIHDSAVAKISALHNVDGSILISLKDYTIHEFNYTMYDSNKLNPLFNVKIEYRRHLNDMYLNYITFNNRFIIEEGQDVFSEISAFYDKELNAFDVKFNNDIDISTIKRNNFRVAYKGKRVFIEDAKLIGNRVVRLQVADFDNTLSNVFNKDMADIDFRIKKLRDINGAKIYKRRRVVAYQFREFFVQEVFEDKEIDRQLQFISKVRALQKAPVNTKVNSEKYIINSPLQKRRIKSIIPVESE